MQLIENDLVIINFIIKILYMKQKTLLYNKSWNNQKLAHSLNKQY
jgi:hypothetical protein